MLGRYSYRLRVLYDPKTVLLLQRVGDLHPGALRRSGFRPEFHLRLSLVPLNGDICDVHVHGVEIQRFEGSKVLIDAGPYAIRIALLFLAAADHYKQPNDGQ